MTFFAKSVLIAATFAALAAGCGSDSSGDKSGDSSNTTGDAATGNQGTSNDGGKGGSLSIPEADSGAAPAAECQANAQETCACPRGNQGQKVCQGGSWSDCFCGVDLSDAGLPPPSACPPTATCQSTMGFTQGVDAVCIPGAAGADGGAQAQDGGAQAPAPGPGGGMGGIGIPPNCTSDEACDAAGLPDAKCVSLMLPIVGAQQLCVQPCTM